MAAPASLNHWIQQAILDAPNENLLLYVLKPVLRTGQKASKKTVRYLDLFRVITRNSLGLEFSMEDSPLCAPNFTVGHER